MVLSLSDHPGWVAPGSLGPDELYDAFVAWTSATGITLYPAQEEAIIDIFMDANLIVSTPTGSGKSLIAVAAHFAALANGHRSFYTAPLKALVSEKFFALVDIFGPTQVGMMTGDSMVNPTAPIICCTAEILANLALRGGETSDVDQVVMDEFHFYGDPDRGWAWQVPLIILTRAQFVLMSATLGDVADLRADISRRTGRETAHVTGAERPVPLTFHYEIQPVSDTILQAVADGLSPLYVVYFSQATAVESAQAVASLALTTREQRDRIVGAISDFRFTTSFGQTLSRLLRQGVGVHHAGLLPKYRRLVEQLAQAGLLRVICGTDTLGVGINVPIRTVLLTALTKFDGTRMRHLTAREFHQIAGRAGRAGFDTAGTVILQAPPHESDNMKALDRAGDDPKKRRKIIRKKAPTGFVSWGEPSFRKLIAAEPEPLRSHMQITSAMLINVIARGGDVYAHARALVYDNHEPPVRQRALARRALELYRSLRRAGVVDVTEGRVHLTVDLQPNFALNQPLSPFALAACELFDPQSPDYPLDLISVVEATLDDPRPVLVAQRSHARAEALARLKADGVDYDERVSILNDIGYPKPHEQLLTQAFLTYASHQPWVTDFELRPKSVVRDLYERAMTFREYVGFYGVARSEGVVLRYLSDAYRALLQTVPRERRTNEVDDLLAWLGELVHQVDSSLVDEWQERVDPMRERDDHDRQSRESPQPHDVTTNRRAFFVLVRNELFRRVDLAARDRVSELGALEREAQALAVSDEPFLSEHEWDQFLEEYYAEHGEIGTDAAARSAQMVVVDESRTHEGIWSVRQIFADPAGDHDWGISAEVLLDASARAGRAVIRVTAVNRL